MSVSLINPPTTNPSTTPPKKTQAGATGGLTREGAMVAAAEALVDDLRAVIDGVVPFFAPEHRARLTVVGQYDAHISRQVAALHEHGLSDLELGDLFEVNRFLQDYKEEVGACVLGRLLYVFCSPCVGVTAAAARTFTRFSPPPKH